MRIDKILQQAADKNIRNYILYTKNRTDVADTDPYLYSDEACTKKVPAPTVLNAFRKGLVVSYTASAGYHEEYKPMSVATYPHADYVVVRCQNADGGEIVRYSKEWESE